MAHNRIVNILKKLIIPINRCKPKERDMSETVKGIQSILEVCEAIKPKEHALVITDNESKSVVLGQLFMDVINSMDAEAVLMVITAREIAGHELPKSVAVAMKSVNAIFSIAHKAGIGHTTARKEATAAGVRHYSLIQISEDDLKKGVSTTDIQDIKERTERLAQNPSSAGRSRCSEFPW